jgi:hypothetical protein
LQQFGPQEFEADDDLRIEVVDHVDEGWGM